MQKVVERGRQHRLHGVLPPGSSRPPCQHRMWRDLAARHRKPPRRRRHVGAALQQPPLLVRQAACKDAGTCAARAGGHARKGHGVAGQQAAEGTAAGQRQQAWWRGGASLERRGRGSRD